MQQAIHGISGFRQNFSTNKKAHKHWHQSNRQYRSSSQGIGFGEGYGEACWNEKFDYKELKTKLAENDVDICDDPISVAQINITVSLGIESILEFLRSGVKRNRSIQIHDEGMNFRSWT